MELVALSTFIGSIAVSFGLLTWIYYDFFPLSDNWSKNKRKH